MPHEACVAVGSSASKASAAALKFELSSHSPEEGLSSNSPRHGAERVATARVAIANAGNSVKIIAVIVHDADAAGLFLGPT